MKQYGDKNKVSGVLSYDYGDDYIVVTFKRGGTYKYTYESAGASHIDSMKVLADNGDGLNTYINKYVRRSYSEKIN